MSQYRKMEDQITTILKIVQEVTTVNYIDDNISATLTIYELNKVLQRFNLCGDVTVLGHRLKYQFDRVKQIYIARCTSSI